MYGHHRPIQTIILNGQTRMKGFSVWRVFLETKYARSHDTLKRVEHIVDRGNNFRRRHIGILQHGDF